MRYRKRGKRKSLAFKQSTRFHHIEAYARLGNIPYAENDLHQSMDSGQRLLAAVNFQRIQGLPVAQRARQSPKTQYVVEMTVCEKDLVKPAKTEAAAQNLALRALAAIYQEAVLLCHHQRS